MKKKSVLITIATILCLTLSIGMLSMAAEPTTFNSKGKIVFDNSTPETTDDVIFDASDLTKLDTMIDSGKEDLALSLSQYPNTNVTPLATFPEIATAIDNLTSIPDIYYYDKATEGDSCVRYMYEDGSYYPCDEYGVKTSDTALSGTITVVTKDDTTEPAAGEIQLVKYESTSAANMSAGSAGFADKSFILGSGSDNITYKNKGAEIIYLGNYWSNTVYTIDLKNYCPDNYRSLTINNFGIAINQVNRAMAKGNKNTSATYNSSTGIYTTGEWHLDDTASGHTIYVDYKLYVYK